MGDELFNKITDATGLPKELIADELTRLLAKAGVDRQDLTMDALRKILAEYVQDVLSAVKDEVVSARAAGD